MGVFSWFRGKSTAPAETPETAAPAAETAAPPAGAASAGVSGDASEAADAQPAGTAPAAPGEDGVPDGGSDTGTAATGVPRQQASAEAAESGTGEGVRA